MDYFDLIKEYEGNLSDAFKNSKVKFLIIPLLLIGYIQHLKTKK